MLPRALLGPALLASATAQTCQWAIGGSASSMGNDRRRTDYRRRGECRRRSGVSCDINPNSLGAADVGSCTSHYSSRSTVWFPNSADSATVDWVEYEYETEILASSVHVHESWGAPFVQSVAVVDSAGAESSIWAGTDSTACGSALSVSVSNPIATKKVKVYTQSSDYEHVNAVQLCGIPTPPAAPPPSPSPPWPPLQPQSCEWADAATASSQYSSSCNKGRSQNACEATGAQNVSGCADAAGAWSPASSVSSEEWLQLTFPTYVIVGSVVIYETYKSKFVVKVELRDAAEIQLR